MYAYVAGFRIAKLWTVPKPFSWPHVSENISLGLWPGTCVTCVKPLPFLQVKSTCPIPASKSSQIILRVGKYVQIWPVTSCEGTNQGWNNPFLQLLWGYVPIFGQWPIFFTSLSVLAPCVFSLCLFWTFPPNMSGQLHMVFHCHKILKTPGFQIRNSIYYSTQ